MQLCGITRHANFIGNFFADITITLILSVMSATLAKKIIFSYKI